MDRVTRYCLDVLAGKEPTGKTELQCCQRHIEDLERQGTEEFPYIFVPEKAHKIIHFAENLVIAEGEGPEPLRLRGWQGFCFGSWLGWVHKDKGYRRFRKSYIQVSRQQGKSLINGVGCVYFGGFYPYRYGQLYTIGPKLKQSKIVLEEAAKFITETPDLLEFFILKLYKSEIICKNTKSVIKALAGTPDIDGFRPLFGAVDEYHLHKTNQLYKLLTDGTKNMLDCLVSVITTAGFDMNAPCKGLYDYCKAVVAGVVEDDRQFVYISELDPDDDIWDPQNQIKACPTIRHDPDRIAIMMQEGKEAQFKGGADLSNFVTKQLNMWSTLGSTQFIAPDIWKKGASEYTLADFKGSQVVIGLDLSSGGDLTSVAFEVEFEEQGQRKFFIDSHSFLPKQRFVEHIETDHAPYDVWAKKGLLTLTETNSGVKTDYKYIIQYIKEQVEKYQLEVVAIAIDPHNAGAFMTDLELEGWDTVVITQSARSLNDATVDFQLECKAGNVYYPKGNALLSWSMINAITEENSFGEIKICKKSTYARIDPCDAVIDAHKLVFEKEEELDYMVGTTPEELEKLGW